MQHTQERQCAPLHKTQMGWYNGDDVSGEMSVGQHPKTVHVRLSVELENRLTHLHGQYRGLNASVLVRMLLADQLRKSDADIDRIVQAAIRGQPVEQSRLERRFGKNTSRLGRTGSL